jgi:hypothetical protein
LGVKSSGKNWNFNLFWGVKIPKKPELWLVGVEVPEKPEPFLGGAKGPEKAAL